MQWVVFGSIWLMIVYFPNGETALYAWPYLVLCTAAGVLAAVSLLRPDPLGLRRTRLRDRPADATAVPAAPADTPEVPTVNDALPGRG